MGSSSSSILMVVLLTVITVTFISRYCYRQYKKHQRHLDHGERTNLHVVLSDIRYTSGNLLESSISLVSVVAKKSSNRHVSISVRKKDRRNKKKKPSWVGGPDSR